MNPVPDAIGEWWISPIATFVEDERRTAIGGVSSTGAIVVAEFDHTTGDTNRWAIGQAEVDDHNVPSLWYEPGRRPIALWTRHGREPIVRCKVGVVGSLSSLVTTDRQDGDAPYTASYTQVYRVEHLSDLRQDTFVVFSRLGVKRWMMGRLSVDQDSGEAAWGEWTPIMQSSGQCYLTTADSHSPGDQLVRVMWGYNPAQPVHAIRYIEVNLVTGAVTSPVDPTVDGNVTTGAGLPLIDEEVEPLIPESAAGWSRRLFYVRPGPASPGVAYADWDENDPDAAVYRTTVLQDRQWVTRDHGTSGTRVGYTPKANYLSGMAFPTPCAEDVVYVGRLGGRSQVERHTIQPDGHLTELLVSDEVQRWMRPLCVKYDQASVVAYLVHQYGHTYGSYLTDGYLLS